MRTLRVSLAGTVILALLGGLSGAVAAEEEEVAREDLTGLVEFTVLEDDGVNLVTTDPRFGGKFIERDFDWVEVPPYGVATSRSRWENEAGAWECAGSEYGLGGDVSYMQSWCVGEGAYDGLGAILFVEPGDDITRGLVFEGDPPPMKLPAPMLDTADEPPPD